MKIRITSASQVVSINALQNNAVSPTIPIAYSFEPSAIGMSEIQTPTQQSFNEIHQSPISSVEIDTASVYLQIGSVHTGNAIGEFDKNYLWEIPNFPLSNSGDFSFGDVVLFTPISSAINTYNCTISKADVSNVSLGADKGLYIFSSYNTEAEKLYLIQRGFVDYELTATNFGDYEPGDTLYLDNNNHLSINVATGEDNWVRSLGTCIPNTDGKKRIWFDPDSTFIVLSE
jgi:hypothetical protein